ncbi:MAG: hypothetical protein WBX08_20180, partial [Candidatus Sulfotelmatobacter sp.]
MTGDGGLREAFLIRTKEPSPHCQPLPGYGSFVIRKGKALQARVPAGLDRKETEIYRQLDP